jgi:hypothetical protein
VPLYIFVAKLWTWLPIGDVATLSQFDVSLWGVATVVVDFYVCVRQLTGQRSVAAASALGLAFSWVFWKQSSIAGVRTMPGVRRADHAAAISVTAEHQSGAGTGVRLSLTHHRMTLLLLPGLACVQGAQVAGRAKSNQLRIRCFTAFTCSSLCSWSSPGEFWNFGDTTVEPNYPNQSSLLRRSSWGSVAIGADAFRR